jgi:hypothetical protein
MRSRACADKSNAARACVPADADSNADLPGHEHLLYFEAVNAASRQRSFTEFGCVDAKSPSNWRTSLSNGSRGVER